MTLDENESYGTYVRYNGVGFDWTEVRRRHGTCRLITLNGFTEIASVTILLHCSVQLLRNQLGYQYQTNTIVFVSVALVFCVVHSIHN